jgi:Ca-activated chloride channel homolog
MSSIDFLHPEVGWWAVTALVAIVLGRIIRRRRFAATSSAALLRDRVFRPSGFRHVPVLTAVSAVALMFVALMDPVLPLSSESVVTRGVDIALVLDLSSSMEEIMGGMAAAPVRQTRLDVTKRALSEFIRARPGDRIGLVVFSDNAYVVSPLTIDHDYLVRYVDMIDNQILRGEGMTAIGEGLAVANSLLDRQAPASPRDRVIVVFTDGENTYGRDPLGPLETSRQAGYRVHLVGVDLEAEVKGKPEVLRLVRKVRSQGGSYFTADTAGQLRGVARAIDTLETGTLTATRAVRNEPAFVPFACAAIVLVCAALLLRGVRSFVDLT